MMGKPFGPRSRASRRAAARLALSASIAFAVSGCAPEEPVPEGSTRGSIYWVDIGTPAGIGVIFDGATSCQYISVKRGYGESITPRLGPDGNPMCGARMAPAAEPPGG